VTEDESSAATVAGLSVAQKASLCLGSDYWHTAGVSEFGIEPVMLSDGPHGLRKQPQPGEARGQYGSVPATCFPTASALASSWDPGLAREVGAALGLEARAQGVAVVLGPGVNLKRSPLCGRNFEYLSEDPFLAGRMAAAIVGGLQSQDVGGCVNHLAGNNQETDRMRVSADVDERTLREIYLPAFEHVVTVARPWLVMCAYNKVNGTYTSQHRWLLTEVLRGEWGFDGLVVSDWGAVHDRVAALIAGLDLEMPPNLGVSDRAIADAVAAGDLAEEVLDQAAGRVIGLVRRARRRRPATVDVTTHHELARRAAAQSMVLLKNDGVLPLAGAHGRTVAVIGELARTPAFQAGGAPVSPTRVDVPLEELTTALPSATVRFAAGYTLGGAATRSQAELTEEAVQAAAGADVAVVFLGLPPGAEQPVTIGLTARDLSYWSAAHRRWVLEPGEFRIAVGASSRDIRLAETIVVAGSPPALPLTASSTLTEWLADPAGDPALRAAFGTGPDGTPGGILSNDELVRDLGDFPLPVLAVFGVGITPEQVSELLAAMPAPPGASGTRRV